MVLYVLLFVLDCIGCVGERVMFVGCCLCVCVDLLCVMCCLVCGICVFVLVVVCV